MPIKLDCPRRKKVLWVLIILGPFLLNYLNSGFAM
jgi:hypothetical protein